MSILSIPANLEDALLFWAIIFCIIFLFFIIRFIVLKITKKIKKAIIVVAQAHYLFMSNTHIMVLIQMMKDLDLNI